VDKMEPFELIMMIIGTLLAIFAYSYPFVGVTRFYLLAECVYVASASAMAFWIFVESIGKGLFIPLSQGELWLVIPLILGVLTFIRFSKRYSWMFNYSTAIVFGFSLGVAVAPTIQTWILSPTVELLSRTTSLQPDPGSAILVFVATIASLVYFLYSSRWSGPFYEGRLRWLSKLGRIFVAVGIGYLLAKVEVIEATDWALGSFWYMVIKRTVDTLIGLIT